jgi:hypothetical protein
MAVGLLCFLFFVGPWFVLAAWVWRETGGLAVSKRALLGSLGPEDRRAEPAPAAASAPPPNA